MSTLGLSIRRTPQAGHATVYVTLTYLCEKQKCCEIVGSRVYQICESFFRTRNKSTLSLIKQTHQPKNEKWNSTWINLLTLLFLFLRALQSRESCDLGLERFEREYEQVYAPRNWVMTHSAKITLKLHAQTQVCSTDLRDASNDMEIRLVIFVLDCGFMRLFIYNILGKLITHNKGILWGYYLSRHTQYPLLNLRTLRM